MEGTTARRITLRLPEALYYRIKRLAAMRQTNISRLAREGLEAIVSEALEAELRAAYDALGAEGDTDAELFLPAQIEVLDGE